MKSRTKSAKVGETRATDLTRGFQTARVNVVRRGFICVQCGYTSMDSGLCYRCNIPLEETPQFRSEDDLRQSQQP